MYKGARGKRVFVLKPGKRAPQQNHEDTTLIAVGAMGVIPGLGEVSLALKGNQLKLFIPFNFSLGIPIQTVHPGEFINCGAL